MKISEARKYGFEKLEAAGVPDPDVDARELLFFLLGLDFKSYLEKMNDDMTEEEIIRYGELLGRREVRIPLQHITGVQNFMGIDFKVSPDVLVPRQDTETLVEYCLENLIKGGSVLDLCTGSGCILISILKNRPDASGIGLDISPNALRIAKENAENAGVIDRVSFMSGDLYEPLKILGNRPMKFSMIVSNPPYIPTLDIEGLSPEVRDHDPFIALDGGQDGLLFYRRILEEAADHLEKNGILAMETGNDQTEAVSNMMQDSGFTGISTIIDMGGNPRVVYGIKK